MKDSIDSIIQKASLDNKHYSRRKILQKTLKDFRDEHQLNISNFLLSKLSNQIDLNLSIESLKNTLNEK
jgi:hypothetical protein